MKLCYLPSNGIDKKENQLIYSPHCWANKKSFPDVPQTWAKANYSCPIPTVIRLVYPNNSPGGVISWANYGTILSVLYPAAGQKAQVIFLFIPLWDELNNN